MDRQTVASLYAMCLCVCVRTFHIPSVFGLKKAPRKPSDDGPHKQLKRELSELDMYQGEMSQNHHHALPAQPHRATAARVKRKTIPPVHTPANRSPPKLKRQPAEDDLFDDLDEPPHPDTRGMEMVVDGHHDEDKAQDNEEEHVGAREDAGASGAGGDGGGDGVEDNEKEDKPLQRKRKQRGGNKDKDKDTPAAKVQQRPRRRQQQQQEEKQEEDDKHQEDEHDDEPPPRPPKKDRRKGGRRGKDKPIEDEEAEPIEEEEGDRGGPLPESIRIKSEKAARKGVKKRRDEGEMEGDDDWEGGDLIVKEHDRVVKPPAPKATGAKGGKGGKGGKKRAAADMEEREDEQEQEQGEEPPKDQGAECTHAQLA